MQPGHKLMNWTFSITEGLCITQPAYLLAEDTNILQPDQLFFFPLTKDTNDTSALVVDIIFAKV